jgi:cysteine-rich repeat protein
MNDFQLCETCALPYCLSCSSLSTCDVCDNSANYFPNESQQCEYCTLSYCVVCSSLSTCDVCDSDANYFINATTQLCQPCSLNGCVTCSSLVTCDTCNSSANLFINDTTQLCQPCVLPNCLICASLTVCAECDAKNNFGLDYLQNRSACGPCNSSCTCDGYVDPWTDTPPQCSSQCGDGFVRLSEECDDGNTINGDGCSSTCLVETNYSCETNARDSSDCYFVADITLSIINITYVPNTTQVLI